MNLYDEIVRERRKNYATDWDVLWEVSNGVLFRDALDLLQGPIRKRTELTTLSERFVYALAVSNGDAGLAIRNLHFHVGDWRARRYRIDHTTPYVIRVPMAVWRDVPSFYCLGCGESFGPHTVPHPIRDSNAHLRSRVKWQMDLHVRKTCRKWEKLDEIASTLYFEDFAHLAIALDHAMAQGLIELPKVKKLSGGQRDGPHN